MQIGHFFRLGHPQRQGRQAAALDCLFGDSSDELEELDPSPADPDETEVRSPRVASNERRSVGVSAIGMPKLVYDVGEDIVVSYLGLPGNQKDWIGLFSVGMRNEDFLDYYQSNGKTEGVMTFEGLRAGQYEARLFFDDSYTAHCQITFSVKERP